MPRTNTKSPDTIAVPLHVLFAIGASQELKRRKIGNGTRYSLRGVTYVIKETEDKYVVDVYADANEKFAKQIHNQNIDKQIMELTPFWVNAAIASQELKRKLEEVFPSGRPDDEKASGLYDAAIIQIGQAEEKYKELDEKRTALLESKQSNSSEVMTYEISKD